MRCFVQTLLFLIFCKSVTAIEDDIPRIGAATTASTKEVGEALFLTRYIKSGQVKVGRQKALVRHEKIKHCTSYSGFITINETYNSNTFFWFVLSQSNPNKDPLVIWMNGGPGSSTIPILLNVHGPISITGNQSVGIRNDTLTKNHNVIYVDNPLGTGFSFTDNEAGYATSQDDVGRDLLAFLNQFFQLFPEYRANDFYVAGDSYGGKFAVTLSRVIGNHNSQATDKINLKGVILGNAFIDPLTQQQHADFVYHIGLVDENERKQIRAYDQRLQELIEKPRSTNISLISLLYYKEVFAKRNLLQNFTGHTYIEDYLYTDEPKRMRYFVKWLESAPVRQAIHVGNHAYNVWSQKVNLHFINDMYLSVSPVFVKALENYPVLFYNGQLDMEFPYSCTQNFFRKLKWSGAKEYRRAKRTKWLVDGELAGYKKSAGNFIEVFVRNAGHIAAFEQPARICSLISQFTSGRRL